MKKVRFRAVLTAFAIVLLLMLGCKDGKEDDGFRHASDPVAAADTLRSKDWRPVLVDSKYGYANPANELVLPPLYNEARHFSEGLAFVRIGRDTGYIDATGKRVIQADGGDFQNGMAVVMKQSDEQAAYAGESWIYIDKNGENVLNKQFYRANAFSEGLASVMPDESGGMVFMDPSGKTALDTVYGYAGNFQEGYAVVMLRQKWGFIDKQGNPLTGFVYDAARDFVEGKAAVMRGDRWGFIDKDGNEIIPPQYDEVGPFTEGLAKFESNGLWGFIEASGRVRVQATFPHTKGFFEGLAVVQDANGLWGYIDTNGAYRIEPRFEAAFGSENGAMLVKRPETGEYGYVDHDGKEVRFSSE
ncbi:WG repeat-containing protein [Saccharibacillus endophyticus]|uniref:WG repeat-containing protein n=1 Tax=Saccharibacillus endophyticus TaxID=2060666 RepID=A0ABQ1ZYH2_9BACL|nr:WG repeat-containing protein [Saccharibacillus endophyticus]GGH82560.1 hypothetical protein GCM10007362_34060 [Saccharibacillus endophyticus]